MYAINCGVGSRILDTVKNLMEELFSLGSLASRRLLHLIYFHYPDYRNVLSIVVEKVYLTPFFWVISLFPL